MHTRHTSSFWVWALKLATNLALHVTFSKVKYRYTLCQFGITLFISIQLSRDDAAFPFCNVAFN